MRSSRFGAACSRGEPNCAVLGFRCYSLCDDGSQTLVAPAWRTFEPMAGWSHAYSARPKEFAARARDLRFRQLTEPRAMAWVDGLEVVVVPGEQISRALYLSGKYEPCTMSVIRHILRRGDVFVDVGANIGLVTLLASRWVGRDGRVVSVEPSRREFERLRAHVDRNALDNVDTIHAAAGDRDGSAVLHVAGLDRSGFNTLEGHFVSDGVEEAYSENVSLVRVDTVVSEKNLRKVDVIKVDVEGGEHDVLDGARQTIARDKPALLLEVGDRPDQAARRQQTEGFLREHGYAFVAIDGDAGVLRRVDGLGVQAENVLAAQAGGHRGTRPRDPGARLAARHSAHDGGVNEQRERPAVPLDHHHRRNDDFGGGFNDRLFRALEFNHHHLRERGVSHEFVFVEWRPIPGKPWLADVLADRYPELVPHALTSYVADGAYHDAFSLNPKLQFQEFIAKNIGIRRCRGAFILTTNTDIYLGRSVLELLERQSLETGVLYRVPRIDLKDDIDCDGLDWNVLEDDRNYDTVNRIAPPCYTNASGDFLLLDRGSYMALRGFNEIYRVAKIHMDGNFCIKAYSSGLKLQPMESPVYHVGLGTLHSQAPAYANRPGDAPWGDRRWNGTVVYENHSDWGLWRAPMRTIRPGLNYLEFSWDAVPARRRARSRDAALSAV
jgi:FkbM family methyltransferase